MPTVFTHALVGASLSPISSPGVSRARLALTLSVLAVAPDLDVIAFFLGIPYHHPLGHRGFSHSLLFAAVLSVLAILLFFREIRPLQPAWWRLMGLGFAAAASHGFLDAFTNGGLGVGFLVPFWNERFFFPWRPINVSPIGLWAFLHPSGVAALSSEIV